MIPEAASKKKALGLLRASLIAELWPGTDRPYFTLPTWQQERVDYAVAERKAA